MNQSINCVEDEYNWLFRVINFRLSPKFKSIGILGAVVIMAVLIGYKFLGSNTLMVKKVLSTLMLLFMLLACLSKDSLEDEFNKKIRYQSYVVAFVCAAVYAISIPLIALVFDILITQITGDGSVSFHEISAFEVLFIMLGFQILFFETLKRFERAQ